MTPDVKLDLIKDRISARDRHNQVDLDCISAALFSRTGQLACSAGTQEPDENSGRSWGDLLRSPHAGLMCVASIVPEY